MPPIAQQPQEIMNAITSINHILVIEDLEGLRTIVLKGSTYSLGRHTSNDIVVSSKLVSRNHATFLRVKYKENQEDIFWLIDGDLQGNRSTNGLLVNDKRCLTHELRSGDEIIFGGDTKAVYYKVSNEKEISTDTGNNPNTLSQEEIITQIQKKYVDTRKSYTTTTHSNGKDNAVIKNSEDIVARLTNFPEFLPHAIIEINYQGKVEYLNRIAIQRFPGIESLKMEHPLLSDILNNPNIKDNLLVREVAINEEVFEQYVHYLEDSKLIRCYIFDMTERKQMEAALQETEQRYKAVVSQISEGIFLVDATTKQIIEANPAYCDILGYEAEEMLSLTLEEVLVIGEQDVHEEIENLHKDNREIVIECQSIRKDATLIDVEISINIVFYGRKEVLCFTARDITARKQAEALLEHRAFHDILTDLPNRALFSQELTRAIDRAKNGGQLLGVIFLDLDRFKNINDTLGHARGDTLLKRFTDRIKSFLPSHCIFARWGGDEFTFVLPCIRVVEDSEELSKNILENLKQPFEVDGYQLYVKASIGISIYPKDGDDGDTLLKNADIALYRAKDQGKNQYRFYSPMMNSLASGLLTLENHLHSALDNNELFLAYQPRINIKTGKVTGMEALLRWKHPEQGLISPDRFIPLAEETGLIIPIGEWVLRTATEQNRLWQDMGLPPLRISVNLSPRQFQQPDLVAIVSRALSSSGLAPEFLELEITEGMVIHNIDFARQALVNFQQMGVMVAMDDFGTGYSSLGYLKQLPFQTLKIDQCFIRDLRDEPQDIAIIKAVTALGKGFNLTVVAEGVETQEQLDILRRLDCEEIQGYLFSKPLPTREATQFLMDKSRYIG